MLYSAVVLDKPKAVRKKKSLMESAEPEAPVKKPRTEKQIAAAAKAAATRKAKKEAIATSVAPATPEATVVPEIVEAEIVEAVVPAPVVKKPRTEKQIAATAKATAARKAKREEKELSDAVDKAIDVPVKRKRKTADDTVPTWFRKYVDGVKNVESEMSSVKKPKRTLVRESKAAAEASWGDGLTRNMVQNEVDGHLARLHGMIFSGRRMK